MKMNFLIAVLLLSIMLITVSCEPVKTDITQENVTNTTASDGSNVIKLPVSVDNKTIESKLDSVIWINPGKVYITNLFPGSQAEWKIRIHNEKKVPNVFSVYYRNPDYVEKGYEKLPEKFKNWIVVDKTITVAPNSIGEVLVTVKMGPKDQAFSKKYEVWIAVMDDSQQGMIRTELCSRWFISTQ